MLYLAICPYLIGGLQLDLAICPYLAGGSPVLSSNLLGLNASDLAPLEEKTQDYW